MATDGDTQLDRLAMLAAHGLRSPLCTISVLADLLEERAAPRLDDESRAWLGDLRAGIRRIGTIVEGMLVYCGVGEDDEVHTGPVDLATVVAEIAALLAPEIERTGAEVVIEPLPVVRGDERQLSLVLQNLAGNALRFAPADSGPRVRVSAVAEDGRWRVRVDDEGIGMGSRQRDVDPFDGAGIGLATVGRIVERHGGRLWVEASPGGGARFSFTVPGDAAPLSRR